MKSGLDGVGWTGSGAGLDGTITFRWGEDEG
ncbi:hypothetical protein SAMN04488602_107208 [Paenibacillus sp. cl123]|nr:hypothetical protein SAMN04488602_107208 [Paenibacillus sp. cl123]